ncbi:Fe2+-dependent dioxygenase [Lentisphaera marina]|uniref:Fe2+-dependent dioxygenase n=1 Tax=Lentisphaera marina TaxID=1111041 RepID=UPI002366E572|nr:Fe2+-dependent dioxygenase [Lentisphaera marina]MDD7985959.1 Fe2+-dependent dioxygenase [Lentisphaera marina]
MSQIIKNIYTQETFAEIAKLADELKYVSGKVTATGKVKDIKNNLQADLNCELGKNIVRLIRAPLYTSQNFNLAAAPAKITVPIIARYSEGMTYGFHCDAPLLNQGEIIRTDLSCTIFLNDDYEGGELEIKTEFGNVKIKGEVGDVLVYPSGTLHRVCPVTSGVRRVAVLWIQSRIRDLSQRNIIQDLSRAILQMDNDNDENGAYALVKKSYDNLVRKWTDI